MSSERRAHIARYPHTIEERTSSRSSFLKRAGGLLAGGVLAAGGLGVFVKERLNSQSHPDVISLPDAFHYYPEARALKLSQREALQTPGGRVVQALNFTDLHFDPAAALRLYTFCEQQATQGRVKYEISRQMREFNINPSPRKKETLLYLVPLHSPRPGWLFADDLYGFTAHQPYPPYTSPDLTRVREIAAQELHSGDVRISPDPLVHMNSALITEAMQTTTLLLDLSGGVNNGLQEIYCNSKALLLRGRDVLYDAYALRERTSSITPPHLASLPNLILSQQEYRDLPSLPSVLTRK